MGGAKGNSLCLRYSPDRNILKWYGKPCAVGQQGMQL